MSPANHFDSQTVSLMGRVCDEAWIELQKKNFFPTPVNAQSVHTELAARVLDAVNQGERNPERLWAIALEAAAA